jgi:hypothetical protein
LTRTEKRVIINRGLKLPVVLKRGAPHDENGRAAIQRVFEEKPDRYLAIVAALLPQKIDLKSPLEGMGDDELCRNLEIVQALRLKLDVAAATDADHA